MTPRGASGAGQLAGKILLSGGILGLIVGVMLHFHITTYAYLASAFTGSLAIYLCSRPSLRSFSVTVLLGAVFAALFAFVKGGPVLGASLAFLGMGSLGSLGLAAVWTAPEERAGFQDSCLAASMFPLFLIVAGFSLAVTSVVHPKTYDLFLYAFDEQLGVQPSFLIGRLFRRFGLLENICFYGYEGLPFAMALAFALDRSNLRRNTSGIMLAFTVAAAGGFLLYNLYPAVGPVHVFGAQFPYNPPAAALPPYRLVEVASAPRNAMPSVHIAMAVLILWNSRAWPAVFRVLAGVLLALTILATLGFGEHYLADLCVAVPFALLAQGIATSGLTRSSTIRAASVATGAFAVLAWIAYLRLPSPPLEGRAIVWFLLFATAAVSIVLESRLWRARGSAMRPMAASSPACAPPEGEYAEV